MGEDKRLIEDFLPLKEINEESFKEKSARRKEIRRGHISKLHLYWARRPLVACRAAVYAALVPGPRGKKGRERQSTFVKELATYPPPPAAVAEAKKRITRAHGARLSEEGGRPKASVDLGEERCARPRVLDMFAGGGAFPLEASRLGCEAHAVELNPLAHLIQLATLIHPRKHGLELARLVERWGEWVIEEARREAGDLHPTLRREGELLTPIAYLWTRRIRCKNPSCDALVPSSGRPGSARKRGDSSPSSRSPPTLRKGAGIDRRASVSSTRRPRRRGKPSKASGSIRAASREEARPPVSSAVPSPHPIT